MIYGRYDHFALENYEDTKIPTYPDETFITKLNSLHYDYYTISVKTVYRPDLIAYNFLDSEKLHWVLTYINNIDNSPEGYYVGRVIKIPRKNELWEIL